MVTTEKGLIMEKIDIYDLTSRLKDISNGLKGLETIAHYSDAQIIAADFAPMLLQLHIQLNREIENIDGIAEGLK